MKNSEERRLAEQFFRVARWSAPQQRQEQCPLQLKGADVAQAVAGGGAWGAALVGGERRAHVVGAAARIARVDGGAARQQRLGKSGTAVILQRAQQRVGGAGGTVDRAVRQRVVIVAQDVETGGIDRAGAIV